jgi:hypothetical protein
MKSSLLYSFLLASLFIAGCRKDDNPKVPDLEKVPLPQITQKAGTTLIPGDDPASFTSTVTVDLYYPFGLKPKYIDLVVIKNGDVSNPKVIQANITSFPTDVEVTGQQLIDLFGAPIGLGDNFQIGGDVVTLEDKRFAAFPPGGETYAPGIANLPGISTQLRFAAPCLFDPALYTTGDYEVVTDEWGDYGEGDVVAVTKIDDTHYSFKYLTNPAYPIIMEVNPVDNSITVAPVVYGDYPQFGVVDLTAQSVPGPSSMVDPCDISFSVRLDHSDAGGSYGEYVIKLRKL